MLGTDTGVLDRNHPTADSSADPSNDRLLEPVLRVSSRLLTALRRSEYGTARPVFDWKIAVCKDESLSQAFAHPVGWIRVCTGAFRIAQTEAGLAALLSHELAHALKHCTAAAPELCPSRDKNDAMPFTLGQELEADGIGMNLMADAGYDPSELLLIWERMKQKNRERDDVLLMHVTYDRRMDHIKAKLPDALRLYAGTHRAPQRTLPVP